MVCARASRVSHLGFDIHEFVGKPNNFYGIIHILSNSQPVGAGSIANTLIQRTITHG